MFSTKFAVATLPEAIKGVDNGEGSGEGSGEGAREVDEEGNEESVYISGEDPSGISDENRMKFCNEVNGLVGGDNVIDYTGLTGIYRFKKSINARWEYIEGYSCGGIPKFFVLKRSDKGESHGYIEENANNGEGQIQDVNENQLTFRSQLLSLIHI